MSKEKREKKEQGFRTTIGGQALIEGILMRGPQKQAIVVRLADGTLQEKTEELKLIKDRFPILGWPLIRGVVIFFSSLINGVKALMYSADCLPEEEQAAQEDKLTSGSTPISRERRPKSSSSAPPWSWALPWPSSSSWCCPISSRVFSPRASAPPS